MHSESAPFGTADSRGWVFAGIGDFEIMGLVPGAFIFHAQEDDLATIAAVYLVNLCEVGCVSCARAAPISEEVDAHIQARIEVVAQGVLVAVEVGDGEVDRFRQVRLGRSADGKAQREQGEVEGFHGVVNGLLNRGSSTNA